MLPDGRGGHANICGKGEGAEARDSWRRVARSFCPVSNPPPHGCEVEAMAESVSRIGKRESGNLQARFVFMTTPCLFVARKK